MASFKADKLPVVPGVWKNSYHFIVANLYAAQCGDIKQLFQTETFRSNVPLRRINADPFDPEDDLTASFADNAI